MSIPTRIVALLLQAADGTTDLAQQLPKALQQAILRQVSEEYATPELLSVLVRCAAEVQQAQEQQLAQQQGEIAQLRRELRGVQASLAAVLQQLQGQAGPGFS
jgi:septal ring factor EnvC (AmiA/AmiB activator)